MSTGSAIWVLSGKQSPSASHDAGIMSLIVSWYLGKCDHFNWLTHLADLDTSLSFSLTLRNRKFNLFLVQSEKNFIDLQLPNYICHLSFSPLLIIILTFYYFTCQRKRVRVEAIKFKSQMHTFLRQGSETPTFCLFIILMNCFLFGHPIPSSCGHYPLLHRSYFLIILFTTLKYLKSSQLYYN